MFEKPVEIYIGKEYGVVLHKQKCDFEMWATHEFRTDAPDEFYWGHYTPDYAEAKDNFDQRVRNLL